MYLFLVTVADADGLSWYSERALCRTLSWDAPALRAAREELCSAGLIAYRKPLYQVLDLAPALVVPKACASVRAGGEAVAIGDLLRGLAMGGAQ